MKFKVEPAIFKKWPEVRIGLVVVLGMDNTKSKAKINQLLAEEVKQKKEQFANVDLKLHPKIAPWREIYHQFGSKPRKYRPSVESLLRRVVSGQRLPNINPLVDLYNYLSLKYVLPAGAEDLDKVKGDIVLGIAKGTEGGQYIGAKEASVCYAGEVIYRDDLGFICRRWNWREGDRTKLTPESTNAVVVLEANANVTDEELKAALKDTAELIKKHLGGRTKAAVLDAETEEFEIDFKPGSRLTAEEVAVSPTPKPTPKPAKVTIKKAVKPEVAVARLFKTDRESYASKLTQALYQAAVAVVGKRGVTQKKVVIEHPDNPEHGDYSTSLALQLDKKDQPTNFDLANAIVNAWRTKGVPDYVAKIEVVNPGFINIWLKTEALVNELGQVLKRKTKFGSGELLKGRRVLLEHTSPNPQTTIMLGHLRNNFLGMAVANLWEFLGVRVTKDCIVNDRGIHLCRAIWGYLVFGRRRVGLTKTQLLKFKKVTNQQLRKVMAKAKWGELLEEWAKKKAAWWQPKDLGLKSDHANLIWYVLGSRAYEMSARVKKQIQAILQAWEAGDETVWQIWRQLLDWSAKGYEQTYRRVGSAHDWVWHESDHYQKGKEWVTKGLEKGVFRRSKGAVVTDLAEHGLPDTVVVKADGTALYITQDLALTKLKIDKFPADLYVWDIGVEQALYFRQLFTVCEQLGIAKREKLFHLNYALINLRGGKKMSTRRGDVVMADEVLDLLAERAGEVIQSSNQDLRGKLSAQTLARLAEKVAVGAVKYSLLKYSRETTIQFDIDESLALEGNSAPYLQYTAVRCRSVLQRAGNRRPSTAGLQATEFNGEEMILLRTIFQFPEVIADAAQSLAPNLICNYLFDLAQKYNYFYNHHSILKADSPELVQGRLALTAATGQVITNGLRLLGIEVPKRM